jgi:hypothetical protein
MVFLRFGGMRRRYNIATMVLGITLQIQLSTDKWDRSDKTRLNNPRGCVATVLEGTVCHDVLSAGVS